MKNQTVSTTITIPAELLDELEALKQAEIEAAQIEMSQDYEYQAQVIQMEAEFAVASWEALKFGESEYETGRSL
ncbi:hypothetical protein NG798_00065 [Ancylothrix sp. C2]|uniref:hypothetical protein n=1 Tax=Ancylothrix sp. D3o TaxID=2953691 RepID=UPI0021BA560C|nr:hypothetical protein [Ancylothrix sp. D3o]MCT7948185.1 hypothetical protein [Ancylothrix sp. D3o]